MTDKVGSLDLEAFDWKALRSRFKSVNPELAEIIDELNPDSSYKLYVARYPFGAQILDNGEFCLSTKTGETIPFASKSIPSEIHDELGYNYNTNPISMVLHNNLEMFVTLEDRVVPFSIVSPGKLFGLWRCLDALGAPASSDFSHTSIFLWGMTAGARSIFMLPKVSEALAHSKLKQAMKVNVDKPNSLLDHWRIFREIARRPNFSERWDVEVVLFGKKWRENLTDPAWLKLRYYFLNTAWHNTQFWRNQFLWNLTFTRIQALRRIKASPYIADTVKHILAIGTGAFPGFRPALDSSLAPIKGIQEAYLNYYELKDYAPILMQPANFDFIHDKQPIYYSLQFPTACELTPRTSGRSSAISDLYDVRALTNKYLNYINDRGLSLESTTLYELAKNLKLEYYHNNVELYEGMRESGSLVEDDSNFKKAMEPFRDREFPKNSAFLKGAVSILFDKSDEN